MDEGRVIIRKFTAQDRNALRRISCQTAFLGKPYHHFFEDKELLADLLTMYFTDYEPGSCFVATDQDKVIGYLIGSKDSALMRGIFYRKILLRLLIRAAADGIIFKRNTWRFLVNYVISFFRGEFFMPDFSKKYPAVLHINIDEGYRGLKIGIGLIEKYLGFLRENKISGVHFGTISDGAAVFFGKAAFKVLYKSRRSYLKYYLGKDAQFYIFGRTL